jgi:hypothetical protein
MEYQSNGAPGQTEDDCDWLALELLGLTLGDAPC